MTSINTMKQALKAISQFVEEELTVGQRYTNAGQQLLEAIESLRTAIQQAESEPVGEPRARVELIKTGGNAGLSTRIIELDIATRERLRPGDLLYTHPAPGVPGALKDHQIAAMVNTLRDIARMFHGHQSLRERIANVLVPALKAEAKTDEPVAWLDEMLADTKEVFDANGTETPQVVRDVIEYVASWITVYNEKHRPAPGVPDVVVRDAERYRWLRATTNWASSKGERIDVRNNPELWDSAIDAAMLAASPAQKGGE